MYGSSASQLILRILWSQTDFKHIYNCPQRILFWASFIQPKTSSPIFPIYVKKFQVTILCKFPHQIPVGNSPQHHTCRMSCPSRTSWYCQTDNAWSSVLCSRVISCIWNHISIIWGVKDAICMPSTDSTNIESRDTGYLWLWSGWNIVVWFLLIFLLFFFLLLLLVIGVVVVLVVVVITIEFSLGDSSPKTCNKWE